MEIRDPVHGSIHITTDEAQIIKADFFQRLRNIKQLGFSEYVFPGATHTRFIHSIGVMHIADKAFEKLFYHYRSKKEYARIKKTFKLACLLHDIGHAPLSHSTETVMPRLRELSIPSRFLAPNEDINRQATHEDYTIKAIADSSFALSFTRVEKEFQVDRKMVADLISGRTDSEDYFKLEGINYFPLLSQLVSSEMDCDRMDYLLRDSYFCGVSYGQYDLDWLLDNLEACIIDDSAYLGINERAVVTFDDFLLSRYHMFIMVYFHYRSVCLEQLLYKYFSSSSGEYQIPADIEKYIEHDDHHLMKVLRTSKNPYAQSIVKNQIPAKIYESFNDDQLQKLKVAQQYLEDENIDYIRCSSASRLSKYYTSESSEQQYSMKVVRKPFQAKEKLYTNINEATDLFSKFSESHAINRLHCNVDSLNKSQKESLLRLVAK